MGTRLHTWPTAGNCLYDVVLNDLSGAYSAGTGIEHPVTLLGITPFMGGRETLPMGGGDVLNADSRGMSLRSWNSHRDYRFDNMGYALLEDRGFTCEASGLLAPCVVSEIVRDDGQVIGLQDAFVIDEGSDRLAIRIRIVAHGQSFADSAVEVTTEVDNLASTEARIGLRYAWNIGMVGAGAAALGPVPPDPPDELWACREGEWLAPSFDYMLASWTNAPSRFDPYYYGGISVNGPWTLDPPPTPPEAITRGADWTGEPPGDRSGPGNTCFAWEPYVPPRGGPPTPGTGGNEAAAWFWGRSEESAIPLAPGETRTFTVWFWAFIENPVTCSAVAPPHVECAGTETPVLLDGSASRTHDGNPLLHRWSSPDAGVTFDDSRAESTIAHLPGVGTWTVRHDVGIGPYVRSCDAVVEVADTTPPRLVVPADVLVRTSELGTTGCTAHLELRASAEDSCSSAMVTHVTYPDIGSGGELASHDFPLGTTYVAFHAVDASGNEIEHATQVTVIDDVPPAITLLEPDPQELWPPNHRMRAIHVRAEVRDDCDGSPEVTLVAITSSEPSDDVGDGHTLADVAGALLGSADFDFQLRAERAGDGPGRDYTIVYRASDASGNTSELATHVMVPHDRAP